MEANDKIAAVHKYVEAFAKADMDIIREIYAVNARVEDPVGTEPHEGIDAICAFYEGALASGAKLAFPFQAQTAGFTVDIIDVFEFDEQGKVNSMKAYWGAENMKS